MRQRTTLPKTNEYFLRAALREAEKAALQGEVPVGAVVVRNGTIIGRGHNRNIRLNDPTAHAEILALRSAAKNAANYRLPGCKIYVTLEPCSMCAGALVWSRIDEVIFGAFDPKAGACGSVFNIVYNKKLNHRVKVTSGVLESECRRLMQEFFHNKRKMNRAHRLIRTTSAHGS
jgi:tRNA(adenine34) deaminase